MLRAAACALRAATSRGSPTLGHVRRFAEPSAAASASPEIERLKLELALALEDKKVALALALEKEKAALALALEDKKAAQARGLWETLFGIKRETAQLLNLAAGGAVFIASGTYLMSAMLHDSWALTQGALSKAELSTQAAVSKAELSTQAALSKAEAASQDVRALMTNAQRTCYACSLLACTHRHARADATLVGCAVPCKLVPCAPSQGAAAAHGAPPGGSH
jgi:hypothetical protein